MPALPHSGTVLPGRLAGPSTLLAVPVDQVEAGRAGCGSITAPPDTAPSASAVRVSARNNGRGRTPRAATIDRGFTWLALRAAGIAWIARNHTPTGGEPPRAREVSATLRSYQRPNANLTRVVRIACHHERCGQVRRVLRGGGSNVEQFDERHRPATRNTPARDADGVRCAALGPSQALYGEGYEGRAPRRHGTRQNSTE